LKTDICRGTNSRNWMMAFFATWDHY